LLQLARLILVTLFALQGTTVSVAADDSYYTDKERGWFWYERQPIEPEPAPEPKKEEQAAVPEAPPSQAEALAPGPTPFSAEWLRKNIPLALDNAIDDPTPDNVAAYYYLQRLSMDKANKFSDVAQRVVMADPYLDENARRPLASFGGKAANRAAGAAQLELLPAIAEKAGIWYFYRHDCSYCQAQSPILAEFAQQYGFSVLPISLDGMPPPNGPWTDYQIDRGQAEQLNVAATPTLFLVRPDNGDVVAIAHGLVAMDQLQKRILMAANEAGWLSDDDFMRTRPVRTDLVLDSADAARQLPPAVTANDTNDLLATLRSMRKGVTK